MASDEQRVRTMAGWIGVEISRSRVRTPGKAGYGLYRVRGSVGRTWHETRELLRSAVTEDLHGERGPWTAYAFTLERIEMAIRAAIMSGTPARPGPMWVHGQEESPMVPTRWTQAYRGKRNLGVMPDDGAVTYDLDSGEILPVAIRPEYAAELTALAAFVDEGLVAMTHVAGCMCSGTATLTAECVRATQERSTVKTRQRTSNAEFQAEHLKRRAHGLKRRHAAKLRLNERGPDGPFDLPS
jgi:hypothetical protein